MTEVELKAWLDDRTQTEKTVAAFAEYEGSYEKSDVYWMRPDQTPAYAQSESQFQKVRVRRQRFFSPIKQVTDQTLITVKRKENRGRIEVNHETEFSVSDGEAFELFLTDTGFTPASRKSKKTKTWRFENASIEISTIEHLGDFIEIEILLPQENASLVEQCRVSLHRILNRCGVHEKNIETRYYTQLLEGIRT